MFKKTQKLLAIFILMFVLMATTCFATEDTPVVTSETSDEAVVTSEDTATEDEHNHEEDSTTTETAQQELYEDDLYVIDDSVSMDKLVDSNAFIIGSDVTVSGKVGGDLFVIADTLTLTEESYIYGNLFACANTINVEGIVCDLYSISTDFTITETGIILRDMRGMSTNLNINGSIGRNTYIEATNVNLGETAHIYGDFNYTTKEAIQVPSGSVDGTINYTESVATDNSSNTALSYVMDCVYAIVYTLAVLGIMILVAPKFLNNLPQVVAKKSIMAFCIGLGALVIPWIVAIILMITVVGVPVAISLLAVWAFAVFALSSSVTTIAIAKFIGSKVPVLGKAHSILAVILVTIVLWGLNQIPVALVQQIISTIVYVFGLGYLFVSLFKKSKKEVE